MRKTNTLKAPTDDGYYVSAAAIADKLIDRVRRGSDPLLLSRLFMGYSPSGPDAADSSPQKA